MGAHMYHLVAVRLRTSSIHSTSHNTREIQYKDHTDQASAILCYSQGVVMQPNLISNRTVSMGCREILRVYLDLV